MNWFRHSLIHGHAGKYQQYIPPSLIQAGYNHSHSANNSSIYHRLLYRQATIILTLQIPAVYCIYIYHRLLYRRATIILTLQIPAVYATVSYTGGLKSFLLGKYQQYMPPSLIQAGYNHSHSCKYQQYIYKYHRLLLYKGGLLSFSLCKYQ